MCWESATPAYVARVSGHLAKVMDRLRACAFGNVYEGKHKDTVGGALAVGWIRHGGIETSLLSIDYIKFPWIGRRICLNSSSLVNMVNDP